MVNPNCPKKYMVTFSPKNAPKSRFSHRQFSKKSNALKRVREIKKTPINKREMLNPRVIKNPFYNKGIWKNKC